MQTATSCEQWAEESCVDYERDSDEEWFECFDADDLEDAKEEEEEEEIEGEDDRDWLEDDEEGKEKVVVAPAIKFESFLQWTFSFDGEPKQNEADSRRPARSIYGCVCISMCTHILSNPASITSCACPSLLPSQYCYAFCCCFSCVSSS